MEPVNIHEDSWIATKMFLTVFLISAFFFKPNLDFVRFEFLTKSLAHYGTTSIEKTQQILSGIKCSDYFMLNGHVYLQPTPGLSFMALVSYLP
ncbi:MAG: hypothetical protein Q8Q91_01130, partial [Candidatus Daviesbacteria bacterium]|nr:hypothetical protein [Candidatus Daviesbacteria bacterium]